MIHPSYPDTFNPCAGHAEITELANSPRLINPQLWFTIEPVYRHIDSPKVGISSYHLSLFEMLTFVDASSVEESSKEKIIEESIGLYRMIGINVAQLYVTTFGGIKLFGREIPADKESRNIWGKILGKNRVHPLKSRTNLEFWLLENEQAGPRCEIFYERVCKFNKR